jgi:hypothetical protein
MYVTESLQGGIYLFKAGSDRLELFLTPAPYTFPTVSVSGSARSAVVSTSEGVLKIDISKRRYDLLKTGESVNAKISTD